jgi:hypothetical protein
MDEHASLFCNNIIDKERRFMTLLTTGANFIKLFSSLLTLRAKKVDRMSLGRLSQPSLMFEVTRVSTYQVMGPSLKH